MPGGMPQLSLRLLGGFEVSGGKVSSLPKKAQALGKEKKQLDDVVLVLQSLDRELSDSLELYEMSKEDGDDGEAGRECERDAAQPLVLHDRVGP